MAVKQVAIRLTPQGGQDVVNAAKAGEDALVKMGAGAAEATERAVAASDRQVAKLREIAAAATDTRTALQAQIDRATGVTGGTNASAKAAAISLWAQDDAYERRGAAIKAALDPASAAMDKLNDELRELDALSRAGKLSTDQLARAQVAARGRYDEAAQAIARQERGLSKLAMASRLNLARQGADVFTTAAMGMNPAMIAIQQGPQIADAWATSNLKLNGSLMLVAGSLGLVAAGVAVGVAAWMEGEKSAWAYERAVSGVGRTAQNNAIELRAAAEAGAEAGKISLKSAQEQANAYAATGKIGSDVIRGLVTISKDYASFMGQDAADATKSLAKAMEDPAKAARDMTREFGLLDQKTIEHIESLVKLGDRQAAQKILMAELSEAVRGHGDKVGDLASFWDVATRSMSNYWTNLGTWLQTTRDEQVAKYDAAIANGRRTGADPRRIAQWEQERAALQFEIGYDRAKAENDARSAAGNQSAQEAKDRADAGKGERERARREAERAARDAERAAREALQRRRREEDREAALDMQIAQATLDQDAIRRLEEQERVRGRIRQLEDDGVKTAQARQTAHSEEARLQDAFAQQSVRETAELGRQVDLEVMRLLGEERSLGLSEKRLDRDARILAYRKAGLDLATATTTADRDQLQIAEARAEVMARIIREAEAEHRLNLARLSGDDGMARWLDIEDRINRRAREIERRGKMNHGEGVDQAQSEVQQELDAEALGARRSWLRGMLSDIKRGGIGDALAEQLDRASDRWLDKLADSLAGLDWGGFLKGLSGGFGGGGWSDALGALLGSGHSAGTDFSEGGFKWVGERGPELLKLPRGSKVTEHNRAMQMTAAAASPVVNLGGLTIKNYGSEPMQGRLTQSPGGGLELELEPMFKGMLARSGRDGSLAKAVGSSPQPRRR
ncbi:phage tail length tape measure family protein [Brevundimonas sp.]|uniref:phage tail length tape measure family protein n=1 Tax=Brevundimonas sp. TaxID=1871086 RepID=UPI00289C7C29|nr:phage tail length tape measure family protein [Brevundimonas sp.]